MRFAYTCLAAFVLLVVLWIGLTFYRLGPQGWSQADAARERVDLCEWYVAKGWIDDMKECPRVDNLDN